MPMYTYRCPVCQAPATRIVRRSEADAQRCEALLEHRPPNPAVKEPSTDTPPAHPAMFCDPVVTLPPLEFAPTDAQLQEFARVLSRPNEASIIIVCDTKLVRPEVELTARTPEAWRT